MQGLSLSSIKKNPALIPLYVCVAAGAIGAGYYILRLATRNPDVTWNRTTNPEPWQHYKDKQYKFYSPVRDYSKTKSEAPEFQNYIGICEKMKKKGLQISSIQDGVIIIFVDCCVTVCERNKQNSYRTLKTNCARVFVYYTFLKMCQVAWFVHNLHEGWGNGCRAFFLLYK